MENTLPQSDKATIEERLDGLLEVLAAMEHERWSHWQRTMHGKAIRQPDGSLVIPSDLVARWEDQISRHYCDLSEKEKESDREQVRRYLPIIVTALASDKNDALSVEEQIREFGKKFIETFLQSSNRENSLAKTKMEEAVLWALQARESDSDAS